MPPFKVIYLIVYQQTETISLCMCVRTAAQRVKLTSLKISTDFKLKTWSLIYMEHLIAMLFKKLLDIQSFSLDLTCG